MNRFIDLKNIIRVAHSMLGIPRWMGENTFLSFWILLLVALLISAAVFYQYGLVERDGEGRYALTQSRFNEEAFQEIILVWETQREKFSMAGENPLRNIFAPDRD